jgi:hypothetical protein
MCRSCGCGEPHDDHGNADQITYEDMKRAADANGISVEETVNNVSSGLAAA